MATDNYSPSSTPLVGDTDTPGLGAAVDILLLHDRRDPLDDLVSRCHGQLVNTAQIVLWDRLERVPGSAETVLVRPKGFRIGSGRSAARSNDRSADCS